MKKKELKKLLKAATTALSVKLTTQAEPPRCKTIGEWLSVYERLGDDRGYKDQTVRNRKALIQKVKCIWGNKQLDQLKPHEISTNLQEFLPERSSTAVRLLCMLKDVYAEAIHNGEVDINPALHVKSPKHSIKRGRLSLDTWKKMLELSKSHPQRWLRALLLLSLLTGQRRADLVKMKFTDVVDGCLRVEQQKKAGKSRGARVALPLTLRLDSVGMSLGEVVELCKTVGKPGEYLLRKANGSPLEVSSLSARFHELIKSALGPSAYGDRQWPSLHEVRSLAAREYRKQGLSDVQGVLGHKHAEMTALYEDSRDLDDEGTWRVVRTSGMIGEPATHTSA